jgi:hypothetical protein
MGTMRGTVLVLPLLLVAAAADEGPKEYQVRPLGFTVAVPAGWSGEQGATGLAAQDAARNGFVVTREPFLHDADTFAAAWQAQLGAAKIDAKVERTKAAGRDAWRASWTAGDRQIDVWRVHAPECEMLYNLSFSGAPGFDLKSLSDATLKSFKCTAPKAELKFQQTPESVTTRISIRLPEGYRKDEVPEEIELGGGIKGGYVKHLPGYDPPHVAGRIRFQGLDASRTYRFPDGQEILGSDTDKLLEWLWSDDQGQFAKVEKKPRSRDATYSGVKGCWMDVPVVGKDGLPLRWMGFVGKHKLDTVAVIVLVDDREGRLHKDYLKQVCSNLVIAK